MPGDRIGHADEPGRVLLRLVVLGLQRVGEDHGEPLEHGREKPESQRLVGELAPARAHASSTVSRCVDLKGFGMNATAPACIACMARSRSRNAVTTMHEIIGSDALRVCDEVDAVRRAASRNP